MLASIKAVLQRIPLIGVCFKPKHPIKKIARESLLVGGMFVVQEAFNAVGGSLSMQHANHPMAAPDDKGTMPEMNMPSNRVIYGKMLLMMLCVAYTRNIVMSVAIQIKERYYPNREEASPVSAESDWRDHVTTKTLVKTLPLVGNFADNALMRQKTPLEISFVLFDEVAMLTLGTLTMALPPMPEQDVKHFFIRYFRMLGGMGAGSVSVESIQQCLQYYQPQCFSPERGAPLLGHSSTQ